MKGAALWPIAVVGVLAVTVAANAVLYVAARDRNAAAVEPDYYRKAVDWDSTLAQERRNAALGWRLEAELSPGAASAVPLSVRVTDRAGRPLARLAVTLVAFHNVDAEHPVSATLVEGPDGAYAAVLPLRHRGMWELRFEAHRGAERFTVSLRREARFP